MTISFPSEDDKREAIGKAEERDKSVSELVHNYFKKLPRKNRS
jgi:uncharacterized protein (UPF0297 family)